MEELIKDLDNNWKNFILGEMNKKYFKPILKIINESDNYYPPRKQIFEAFRKCSFDNVCVVIIGQDPYHEEGEACGLAFSFNKTQANSKVPKSLINIFKEIESDTGHIRYNTDLSDLESQGVLLINSILTVEKHKALSHKDLGWIEFTNNLIKYLNTKERRIVYILWGNHAKSFEPLIRKDDYIIKSAHPSPLSAYNGFFGSKPFTKCNEYLRKEGYKEVRWWDE